MTDPAAAALIRTRRAFVWKQDNWWTVSLHDRTGHRGNLSWPTWAQAQTSALRWTGLEL